jgi:hypothetical protein
MAGKQGDKGGRESIGRLCRQYVALLESPTVDSLFNWLNALHSMHDRVSAGMRSELFKSGEFIALKAIRNHFHHGGEVRHRARVVLAKDVAIMSDLLILCLISRADAETSLDGIEKQYKAQQKPLGKRALKWYGPTVNLYPAIFNLMAKLVLLAREHGMESDDDAFERLAEAVDGDLEEGRSITVTGDIGTHAGTVDQVLAQLMTP